MTTFSTWVEQIIGIFDSNFFHKLNLCGSVKFSAFDQQVKLLIESPSSITIRK